MPTLRTLFLALCLCLVPCLPHAEGLFIIDDGAPDTDSRDDLQIIPVTSSDQKMSPVYARAAVLYRESDAQGAAALREQALNGDMDALFALAALSRLAEAEKRPPLFGAPAAFWEDWAVRMLGGKEAWFRIGAALFECGKTDGLPQIMLWRMATDTLRKAAKLEHPEAMFALAFLSRPYPDTSFQMPKDPGFPIYPSTATGEPEDDSEFWYWVCAGAFYGSARASYTAGLLHLNHETKVYNNQKGFEMFSKSLRLGLVPAAEALEAICTPDDVVSVPQYVSCKSSIFYGDLQTKMLDDTTALKYNKMWANLMMEGNNEYFPEACLTQKEYEEAIRESEQEFERIKADMLARKEAHDALYAKAQPMFAEMPEPFAPHAKDLFARDDGKLRDEDINTLRIIPDQRDCPVYARAAALFRDNDAQGAAALREQTLNGDMDALFALAALSRLAEAEKRPSPFGAPAAFWEDWAVRMLGEKEAWFRIGAALFECGRTNGLPKTTLQQMATDALRKAAKLGHPEAMFALAFLSRPYPDTSFQMPKDPGFPISPSTATGEPEDDSEFWYWLCAGAFSGSARANFAAGLLHLNHETKVYNSQKGFEMLSKSLHLGLVPAAKTLKKICSPNEEVSVPQYVSCKSSIYYGDIQAKMLDDIAALMYNNDLAKLMMEGNNEYFPEVCLTRKEYKEAIHEAEQEFERIKADMLARKEAHDALYAKAQPMFAEMHGASLPVEYLPDATLSLSR